MLPESEQMDYAIDNLTGKVIEAGKARIAGIYRCPVCHSRAVLRGGNPWAIRRKHFAHVVNQARPDCENYHPSLYRAPLPTGPQRRGHGQGISAQEYIRQPELYLRQQISSQFDLQLLLPSRSSGPPWQGELLIEGRFGEQTYGFTSLDRPRHASVPPQLGRYEILKRGEVSPSLWAVLSRGVEGLRKGATCFRQSEMMGRCLRQAEAMYWGETYMVLLPPGHSPPTAFAEWFSHCGELAGWAIFGLTLPSRIDWIANIEREEIGDWLGHEVRSFACRAYLLDPLPHHLDELGRFVLALPIQSIDIYVDEGYEEISIVGGDGVQLDWQEAPDGRISIFPTDTDVIHIYIDGDLSLALSLAACEPFSPSGIRLRSGNEEAELFAAQPILAALRGNSDSTSDLVLRTPSDLLNRLVKLNGKPISDENTITGALSDLDSRFELDARNFGRVSFQKRSQERPQRSLKPSVLSSATWLLSLPQPSSHEPACRITGVRSTDVPRWVRALQARDWSVNYAPHVRALASELRKGGYV